MGLQDYIEPIAKVAEIAGKEYSIEQVSAVVQTVCSKVNSKGYVSKRCNYEYLLAVSHN